MFFSGKGMGIKLSFWFRKNQDIKGENKRMKSFKKIALVMVAAMGLGTLVVTPASANTVSVAVSTAASGSGTAASPYAIRVPFDNVVSVSGDTTTVTNNEALLVTATVVAGTPVTFTAVGANTRLVSTIGSTTSASAGSASITVTPASTTAAVYVYTTSTAASAVTASVTGASTTIYLKGNAGPAYDLKMSIPASGNVSGKVTATFDVADIFGNAVAETVSVTTLGGATAAAVVTDPITTGRYTSEISLPAVTGNIAVGATVPTPTSVPTIKLANVSQTAIVAVSDLATALAAANAALAAEKAARAADKLAADQALAAALAKAASDSATATAAAATAKAAADSAALTAAAEIATLKANAVTAKVAADKALADAVAAEKAAAAKALADAQAASTKALADLKTAFNKLARQWNAKNPKAKVALVK
jgi:hypothetical protein